LGARLKAEAVVCSWAMTTLFGLPPAEQGRADRIKSMMRRMRVADIGFIFRKDIGKRLEDIGRGDYNDVLLYPLVYDFNILLLAQFTEEYRVEHNTSAICDEHISSTASVSAILEHFAKCQAEHTELDFSETVEWMKEREASFWMRNIRSQFPGSFPESAVVICRELSPAEQRALEAIAKAARRDVQYLEPATPAKPEADTEEEDSAADPAKATGLKIRLRPWASLPAVLLGTLLFQLWRLWSRPASPPPARPAIMDPGSPRPERAQKFELDEIPPSTLTGPRPLHSAHPRNPPSDMLAPGMPKPLRSYS